MLISKDFEHLNYPAPVLKEERLHILACAKLTERTRVHFALNFKAILVHDFPIQTKWVAACVLET